MSKKKVLVVAAALLAGGAAIAVSAPGYRGHGMGGGMMDRWLHGDERPGFAWGAFGGRELSRESFDARARELFARFDLNSDGVIDTSEIESALAQRTPSRWRDHAPHKDRERGGQGRSVSKSEYLDEVRRRFALIDLDSDGRITDADLPPTMRGRNVLGRLADGTPPRMRRRHHGPHLAFLRGAPVDDQGGITLDAALSAAQARFDRMDRNGDGKLDRADRQVLAKEMTEYRVKRILHRFGATAEGKITREQAFKVAGDMFDRWDRDKNGTLSRDERPGKWHGHRRHDGYGAWRERRHERGGQEGPAERDQKKI